MTVARDDGCGEVARRDQFAACYRQHRDRLRRYAAWLAPHVDWESAVHDAFVQAYLHWDEITTSPGSWLTTAVHHNVVDLTRGRERPADVLDGFEQLCKLQRSRDGEEWFELMQTFAATQLLPHHQRVAVILRFEGMDDSVIAEVLDVDRATVRRYVSAALRTIAQKVGNQERRLSMRHTVQPQRRDGRTTAQRTEVP